MSKSEFEKAYKNLNTEQKEAVDTIDGPVLVIAGPGTGKTQLLSVRAANILNKTDTLPSSILCLTFTESAATNMRQRLFGLIGKEAHKIAIHTFHSFGSEIINKNPEYFFFGAQYQPADSLAQYKILYSIFENMRYDNPLKSARPSDKRMEYTYLADSINLIKSLKTDGKTPEDFLNVLTENRFYLDQLEPLIKDFFSQKISKTTAQKLPDLIQEIQKIPDFKDSDTKKLKSIKDLIIEELIEVSLQIENTGKTTHLTQWKKDRITQNAENQAVFKDESQYSKQLAFAEIYKLYQEELFNQKLYDFEDMILQTIKVLEDPKYIDLKYNLQENYQYIMVDEFQDTNGAQMRLLNNLSDNDPNNSPNILAVGDDDQAIFKFQGANIQNILNFQSKYKNTKIVSLNQNYRSSQTILDSVMGIISQSSQRLADDEKINKKLVSNVT